MKVYLSGGMATEWREWVRAHVDGHIWIDPTEHGLNDPAEYAAWDLAGVRACDVVFAYMEAGNPSGIGLAFEVGYALALGKTVILVDEKVDARMDIVRAAASVTYYSLPGGIDLLRSLARIG